MRNLTRCLLPVIKKKIPYHHTALQRYRQNDDTINTSKERLKKKVGDIFQGMSDQDREFLEKNHAELSAELSLDFINSQGFQISQDVLDNIIHCIRAHSFSNKTIPKTLEAKILSDVDKLDALGAIGIYRVIGFTIKKQGGVKQVIEHMENKIMKLRDQLYLEESRKIADERKKIIENYYNQLKKETNL